MKKWLQPLRFMVQACFMAGLIVPWLPHPETMANRLFWTVLAVGVFFCGWVCPFGAIQDWLGFLVIERYIGYFFKMLCLVAILTFCRVCMNLCNKNFAQMPI